LSGQHLVLVAMKPQWLPAPVMPGGSDGRPPNCQWWTVLPRTDMATSTMASSAILPAPVRRSGGRLRDRRLPALHHVQLTSHTTAAAWDRRLMPAGSIQPPAHGRRGTSWLVLSLL